MVRLVKALGKLYVGTVMALESCGPVLTVFCVNPTMSRLPIVGNGTQRTNGGGMATEPAQRVEVRPARPADVEALNRFITPFVTDGKLLPRTQDELADLIRTGFVATLEGEIVGFAALEIYSAKLAELRSLAVAPNHQGEGIGRKLVTACLDLAKDRRVFEVMAITSSEDFFRRCGFDFTLPGEKKALFLQTRDDY